MNYILYLFALIPFYALGTFPTGRILARLKGVDITQTGSGNVGATNVSRVLGPRSGIITLAIDVAKGILAVMLASAFSGDNSVYTAAAGVAVVLGHCFSIPGVWRGGKGV